MVSQSPYLNVERLRQDVSIRINDKEIVTKKPVGLAIFVSLLYSQHQYISWLATPRKTERAPIVSSALGE